MGRSSSIKQLATELGGLNWTRPGLMRGSELGAG